MEQLCWQQLDWPGDQQNVYGCCTSEFRADCPCIWFTLVSLRVLNADKCVNVYDVRCRINNENAVGMLDEAKPNVLKTQTWTMSIWGQANYGLLSCQQNVGSTSVLAKSAHDFAIPLNTSCYCICHRLAHVHYRSLGAWLEQAGIYVTGVISHSPINRFTDWVVADYFFYCCATSNQMSHRSADATPHFRFPLSPFSALRCCRKCRALLPCQQFDERTKINDICGET